MIAGIAERRLVSWTFVTTPYSLFGRHSEGVQKGGISGWGIRARNGTNGKGLSSSLADRSRPRTAEDRSSCPFFFSSRLSRRLQSWKDSSGAKVTGVGALSPLSTFHYKSLVSRLPTLPHLKKSVFSVVIIRKPLKPASVFADVCLYKFHVARHYLPQCTCIPFALRDNFSLAT